MPDLPPSHFAFPVNSLATARAFYSEMLGCTEGRSSDSWVDFDFHGHQLVERLAAEKVRDSSTHDVGGGHAPMPHFRLVLALGEWRRLAERVCAAGTRFVVEQHVRFAEQTGELATKFLHDPSDDSLEFKAFADRKQLFAE